MIRLMTDVCAASRAGLCPADMGVFALKQLAQLTMYRQMPGVFDLWLQLPQAADSPESMPQSGGSAVAVVSRFSGVLTVSAQADISACALDELRLFLQQLGGCKLEGEEILLQRLGIAGNAMLPFCGSWVMATVPHSIQVGAVSNTPSLCDGTEVLLRPAQSLSDVYHLLCKADARFAAQAQYDAWLVDFSHRCRHQHSECYILTDDVHIFSTISILYLQDGQALAGGVATDPAWQNRGYAQKMLAEFCRMTDSRGLIVRLLAASDRLAEFYARCGWEKQSRWASRGLAPL